MEIFRSSFKSRDLILFLAIIVPLPLAILIYYLQTNDKPLNKWLGAIGFFIILIAIATYHFCYEYHKYHEIIIMDSEASLTKRLNNRKIVLKKTEINECHSALNNVLIIDNRRKKYLIKYESVQNARQDGDTFNIAIMKWFKS